jgi:hypothetical protein
MDIYFGEVSSKVVNDFGGEYFQWGDKYYDFILKVEEHGITIKDASGRYVPLAHSSVLELFKAVKCVKGMSKSMAKAEELIDHINDDIVITI